MNAERSISASFSPSQLTTKSTPKKASFAARFSYPRVDPSDQALYEMIKCIRRYRH
ncbi:hypothetical protein BJY04DRAFT_89605 [Aspergillus karnatakaensis]|uniref:uncharacterized protein n=1 Tax=Aspergillus karnatakaensis TaxID=1810916 RepID=UPI003CCCC7BF